MSEEEFFKEFGLRVKIYRLKCSFTQAHLGELVNMSEHRISQIENGKCNITLKTINKLSLALNIPSKKLFDFDE